MFTWECVAKQAHELYCQVDYATRKKQINILTNHYFKNQLIRKLRQNPAAYATG